MKTMQICIILGLLIVFNQASGIDRRVYEDYGPENVSESLNISNVNNYVSKSETIHQGTTSIFNSSTNSGNGILFGFKISSSGRSGYEASSIRKENTKITIGGDKRKLTLFDNINLSSLNFADDISKYSNRRSEKHEEVSVSDIITNSNTDGSDISSSVSESSSNIKNIYTNTNDKRPSAISNASKLNNNGRYQHFSSKEDVNIGSMGSNISESILKYSRKDGFIASNQVYNDGQSSDGYVVTSSLPRQSITTGNGLKNIENSVHGVFLNFSNLNKTYSGGNADSVFQNLYINDASEKNNHVLTSSSTTDTRISEANKVAGFHSDTKSLEIENVLNDGINVNSYFSANIGQSNNYRYDGSSTDTGINIDEYKNNFTSVDSDNHKGDIDSSNFESNKNEAIAFDSDNIEDDHTSRGYESSESLERGLQQTARESIINVGGSIYHRGYSDSQENKRFDTEMLQSYREDGRSHEQSSINIDNKDHWTSREQHDDIGESRRLDGIYLGGSGSGVIKQARIVENYASGKERQANNQHISESNSSHWGDNVGHGSHLSAIEKYVNRAGGNKVQETHSTSNGYGNLFSSHEAYGCQCSETKAHENHINNGESGSEVYSKHKDRERGWSTSSKVAGIDIGIRGNNEDSSSDQGKYRDMNIFTDNNYVSHTNSVRMNNYNSQRIIPTVYYNTHRDQEDNTDSKENYSISYGDNIEDYRSHWDGNGSYSNGTKYNESNSTGNERYKELNWGNNVVHSTNRSGDKQYETFSIESADQNNNWGYNGGYGNKISINEGYKNQLVNNMRQESHEQYNEDNSSNSRGHSDNEGHSSDLNHHSQWNGVTARPGVSQNNSYKVHSSNFDFGNNKELDNFENKNYISQRHEINQSPEIYWHGSSSHDNHDIEDHSSHSSISKYHKNHSIGINSNIDHESDSGNHKSYSWTESLANHLNDIGVNQKDRWDSTEVYTSNSVGSKNHGSYRGTIEGFKSQITDKESQGNAWIGSEEYRIPPNSNKGRENYWKSLVSYFGDNEGFKSQGTVVASPSASDASARYASQWSTSVGYVSHWGLTGGHETHSSSRVGYAKHWAINGGHENH